MVGLKIGLYIVSLIVFSSDNVDLKQDAKILFDYQKNGASNNPRFKANELTITHLKTDNKDSFILLSLLKVVKDYEFRLEGFNVIPIYYSEDRFLIGDFKVPMINMDLDQMVFNKISSGNPWCFQRSMQSISGGDYYSSICVDYKQYNSILRVKFDLMIIGFI